MVAFTCPTPNPISYNPRYPIQYDQGNSTNRILMSVHVGYASLFILGCIYLLAKRY